MPTTTPPDRSVAVDDATAPVRPLAAGSGAADATFGHRGRAAIAPPPATEAGPSREAGWSPPIDGHGLFKSLMLRLPRGVRRSLDHEQLLALRQAAEEIAWGEHPIDIRLSLPWPGGRRYVLLVAGRERRELSRPRGQRRRSSPIRVGNHASLMLLVAGGGGLAVLISLVTVRVLGG